MKYPRHINADDNAVVFTIIGLMIADHRTLEPLDDQRDHRRIETPHRGGLFVVACQRQPRHRRFPSGGLGEPLHQLFSERIGQLHSARRFIHVSHSGISKGKKKPVSHMFAQVYTVDGLLSSRKAYLRAGL